MYLWGTPDPPAARVEQPAPAAQVEQPGGPTVVRAVFADGLLWMLGEDGSLASLDPDESEPEAVEGSGRVVDLCRVDGRLVVLSQDEKGGGWLLRTGASSALGQAEPIPAGGETFIALSCDRERIMLVTSGRLIDVVGSEMRSTPLSEGIEPPPVTSTAFRSGSFVWVGFNAGEWGGGLARISRGTGKVEIIEWNRSGDLCGGPLNSGCDPVNGIVASPRDPSCVVAAIGLVHMSSHGRIVEVCGSRVRRLYFKPLDPQPPHGTLDDGEPSSTVAFYGLARADDTLWSVGIDGIYRFSGARVEVTPLPQFQNRGAYLVSFDVPGIALVMTDANQRAAMSGSVPIMAIR